MNFPLATHNTQGRVWVLEQRPDGECAVSLRDPNLPPLAVIHVRQDELTFDDAALKSALPAGPAGI